MTYRGGHTQDEVLAVSLHKLGLGRDDVMVDVGCGTGKVTMEAAKICRRAIGIDSRPEAVSVATNNLASSGVRNAEIIEGVAADIVPGLGRLDAAFVGGSRDLERSLSVLSDSVTGGIVVNAVLLSTLNKAVKAMKDLGIYQETISVQVCRSHELAGSLMFKPIDPVFIVVGRCGRR